MLQEQTNLKTAKEAAAIAIEYYQRISGAYSNAIVEEIELSEDNQRWLITLGIRSPHALSLYGKEDVSYKVFTVDSLTGEVISMKIKKI
jgi:hypothetical protein